MRRLFSQDSPIATFLSWLADTMFLSIVFALCCVPVFTAGAAAAALYRTLCAMRDGESAPMQCFFKTFAQRFGSATKLWMVMLAVTAVSAASGYGMLCIIADTKQINWFVLCFYIVSVAMIAAIFVYALFLEAQYGQTWKETMRNAVLLSVAFLPWTVLLAATVLIPAVMFAAAPAAFLSLSAVWLLGGFGWLAYLQCRIAMSVTARAAARRP